MDYILFLFTKFNFVLCKDTYSYVMLKALVLTRPLKSRSNKPVHYLDGLTLKQ